MICSRDRSPNQQESVKRVSHSIGKVPGRGQALSNAREVPWGWKVALILSQDMWHSHIHGTSPPRL